MMRKKFFWISIGIIFWVYSLSDGLLGSNVIYSALAFTRAAFCVLFIREEFTSSVWDPYDAQYRKDMRQMLLAALMLATGWGQELAKIFVK